MSEQPYTYNVNLNERGCFFAHVEDPDGKEIFRISDQEGLQEMIDDGFMRSFDDITGLSQYLQDLDFIPPGTCLVPHL